jgi:hypothetical protein
VHEDHEDQEEHGKDKKINIKKYKNLNICILQKDQLFGEEDIINKAEKRKFSVMCHSFEGEIFVISKSDFYRIINLTKKIKKVIMENFYKK